MGRSYRALNLGADLVLYSAAKYLSGFSDMPAGVELARDAALIQAVRAALVMFGNIPRPDECWMLNSRVPTVAPPAKHPRGGHPAAFDFPRGLRLVNDAVSLGGVETLACHPKTITHLGLTAGEW